MVGGWAVGAAVGGAGGMVTGKVGIETVGGMGLGAAGAGEVAVGKATVEPRLQARAGAASSKSANRAIRLNAERACVERDRCISSSNIGKRAISATRRKSGGKSA